MPPVFLGWQDMKYNRNLSFVLLGFLVVLVGIVYSYKHRGGNLLNDSGAALLAVSDRESDRQASTDIPNHADDIIIDNSLSNVGHPVSLKPATSENEFIQALERGQTAFIVNPTPQQNQKFENMMSQMDDMLFLQNLSMRQLMEAEDMKELPIELQYVVIDKAISRYNEGLINRDGFYSQR